MKALSLSLVMLLMVMGVANAGVHEDNRDAGTYMQTPHDNNFDNGDGVDNIQPRDDVDMYRDDNETDRMNAQNQLDANE